MPWKTGEARPRIIRWTWRSFPSEERKIVSASGASKSYGVMNEMSAQTVADPTDAGVHNSVHKVPTITVIVKYVPCKITCPVLG